MFKISKKKLIIRASMLGLVVAITTALGLQYINKKTDTHAANEPYGIIYDGGIELQNEVNFGTDEIDDLSPLISQKNRKNTVFSNSSLWLNGYINLNEECYSVKYFKISQEEPTQSDFNGLSFTIPSNRYSALVTIKNAAISNLSGFPENGAVAVAVRPENGSVQVRRRIFTDSNCQTDAQGVSGYSSGDGGLVFIDTNIKLYQKGISEVFKSDKLYFGILDIDSGQSFKLKNINLSKSNMFAKTGTKFQPEDSAIFNLNNRNMFVSSTAGNYIYSQNAYINPNNTRGFDLSGSNIYVKIPNDDNIQSEGLNYVLGYAQPAGSNFEYYSKIYEVNYESDSHGKIADDAIKSEDVISGHNPQGSTQEPDENYVLDKWVADVDVTLTNGDTISAGSPITEAQIKNVVVNSDITFTAIHKMKAYTVQYKSDQYGEITGKTTENVNSGANPTGSEQEPDENYELDKWVANVAVTLKNGDTIPAGDPITEEQIKNVVVDKNITFEAIHKIIEYIITYESDKNGEITGKENENVNSGANPTGSEQEPDENYELDYWVANVDILLKDGTIILAGKPITEEQIKNVVVDQNITFTAIHKIVKKAPETGASTSNNDMAGIAGSSLIVILPALAIAYYIHNRKKSSIKFD